MTPASSILDPNSDPAVYVAAVLTLYVDLPDTPLRASVPDQRQARFWFDRGVPLEVVEAAPNLSSRNFGSIPLPPVTSSTCGSNFAGSPINPGSAKVQKSTFSDDR